MKINPIKLITENVQIVVTVIVVALASSYMGMWSQQDDIDRWRDAYDNYKDSVELLRQENTQLLDRVAQMTEHVGEIEDSIAVLNRELTERTAQIIALRDRLDSIRVNINDSILEITPPEVREYVATLEQTVEVQDSTITELRAVDRLRVTQIDTLLFANELLTAQLDSVNVVLGGIPETPDNPNKILGFIPKPTRTQSFILGTITTLVIVWGVS